MKYRKQMRELLVLDYIILLLSIIGLFIYTSLFLLIGNNIKFVFIIFIIYTTITMITSLKGIFDYYRIKKIKKHNLCRVNLKLFNARKRRVSRIG